MSIQTSFACCSDCGYIGPDFKTEEYLPYVDEGREMPGGKTYECPKCGLTTGEQVIQEHFEPLKADGVSAGKLSVEDRKYVCGGLHRVCAVEDQLRKAEATAQGLREKLKTAEENYRQDYNMAAGFSHDFEKRAKDAESRLAKAREAYEEARVAALKEAKG